ncbi:MAG: hypothetical protein FWE98_01015 [Oscillospiraceae bacterium]|nr:hypothetical protein [Oscillospiraceae bacterium]
MIQNYTDFIRELLAAGFSQFGGSKDNLTSLFQYGWNSQPEECPVQWFSGDPDRDPWHWRERVIIQRNDIAYAKLFLQKHGFITKEWYPYFLAARRKGRDFAEAYAEGLHSRAAQRIYECLRENGALPVHDIKPVAGFGREEKSSFERALTELQMGLYITVCGHAQKISRAGEPYGWSSDVYCLAEEFFPDEVFHAASLLEPEEAAEKIEAQVYKLNPAAAPKKVRRFISG